jgi:hypothetical protein
MYLYISSSSFLHIFLACILFFASWNSCLTSRFYNIHELESNMGNLNFVSRWDSLNYNLNKHLSLFFSLISWYLRSLTICFLHFNKFLSFCFQSRVYQFLIIHWKKAEAISQYKLISKSQAPWNYRFSRCLIVFLYYCKQ